MNQSHPSGGQAHEGRFLQHGIASDQLLVPFLREAAIDSVTGEIPRDRRAHLVLLTKSSNAKFPQILPSNQSDAILWASAISGCTKLTRSGVLLGLELQSFLVRPDGSSAGIYGK
jgi:hypothetical protein